MERINNVKTPVLLIFYFNSQEEQYSVAVDTSSHLVEMVLIPQNPCD